MKQKAKVLQEESRKLFNKADKIEQSNLLPKFKYLEGKCFMVKDSYMRKTWHVYYLVKKVNSVWIQPNKKESVSLSCFAFDTQDKNVTFNLESIEFHDTLKYIKAKEITRSAFNKALNDNIERIKKKLVA